MRAFRIADRRFPLLDGAGAARVGGRWNSPGRPAVYAAETYAGALLEILVHANLGRLPATQVAVEITIPGEVGVEVLEAKALPGWDAADLVASRAFGDRWLAEQRSAVLLVPSVVTQGRERNVVLNPLHADFRRITASRPEAVAWDERLWPRSAR
jgi:RES domain-containing protein